MNELITENKLFASVVLIVGALIVRWLFVHYLSKRPLDEEKLPRRWINSVKNAANLLIVIGLIIIWLSELRFMALSIAAFVVALVIATREFIQCILGSLYMASSRIFVVGDWVRIGAHCGEVTRSDWLSTTLLEVDMESKSYGYTGRSLVVPNNQFLTSTVENLNFMRRYIAHTFSIIREADRVNVFTAKDLILGKAREYSASYCDVAERYNGLIEKRLGVSISGPEASVRITTTDFGKNVFEVTVFCPTHEAVSLEQRLTEDFMNYWYGEIVKEDAVMSSGGALLAKDETI